MENLVKCKACGNEIAKNAKICPSCGAKNKKPFYKAWWFWVIVVFVVLIIGGSISGNDDTSESGNNVVQNETVEQNNIVGQDGQKVEITAKQTQAPVKKVYRPGESADVNGLVINYESAEIYQSDNQFLQPKDGNMYIAMKISAENKSSTDKYISSFEFECYADGAKTETFFSGENSFSGGEISQGRKVEGYLYFEVPENAKTIEVEYETNFWTDKKIIFLVQG